MPDDADHDAMIHLSRNQRIHTIQLLCTFASRGELTKGMREEGPVNAIVNMLFAVCEATPIVSCVAGALAEEMRTKYDCPDAVMLAQYSPTIAASLDAAPTDVDGQNLAARVQRSVQWVNAVWAEDDDAIHGIWGSVEEQEPDMRASDIAQTLSVIEGIWEDMKDGSARACVLGLKR